MEKDLLKLQKNLTEKIPIIVEAIEKTDPTTKEYADLINNFNASMVVFSELTNMFNASLKNIAKEKEEKKDGANN